LKIASVFRRKWKISVSNVECPWMTPKERFQEAIHLKKYPEQLRETKKNLHGQVIDTSRFPNRPIEDWSNR